MLSLSCRYVPLDLWMTTHIHPDAKVSSVKKLILSKCTNPSGLLSPSRPSSPITFAPQQNRRPMSPIVFAPVSEYEGRSTSLDRETDSDSLFEDVDEDEIQPDDARIVRPRPQAQAQDADADADSDADADGQRCAPYTLIRFSTGQLLEDDFSLNWYALQPHELLELHRPGIIHRLARHLPLRYITPYFEAPVRALRVVWRDIAGSYNGPNIVPVNNGGTYAGPGQGFVAVAVGLGVEWGDENDEGVWLGHVIAEEKKDERERSKVRKHIKKKSSAAAASATNEGEKRRKTKLEWRDRWLVIREGHLDLCKDQNDPNPNHLPLSALLALRSSSHLARITTIDPGQRIVCAKFLPRTKSMRAVEAGSSYLRKGPVKPKGDKGKARGKASSGRKASKGIKVDHDPFDDDERDEDGDEEEEDEEEDDEPGEWIILDLLEDNAFNAILRILHRHHPLPVSSTFIPRSITSFSDPASLALSSSSSSSSTPTPVSDSGRAFRYPPPASCSSPSSGEGRKEDKGEDGEEGRGERGKTPEPPRTPLARPSVYLPCSSSPTMTSPSSSRSASITSPRAHTHTSSTSSSHTHLTRAPEPAPKGKSGAKKHATLRLPPTFGALPYPEWRAALVERAHKAGMSGLGRAAGFAIWGVDLFADEDRFWETKEGEREGDGDGDGDHVKAANEKEGREEGEEEETDSGSSSMFSTLGDEDGEDDRSEAEWEGWMDDLGRQAGIASRAAAAKAAAAAAAAQHRHHGGKISRSHSKSTRDSFSPYARSLQRSSSSSFSSRAHARDTPSPPDSYLFHPPNRTDTLSPLPESSSASLRPSSSASSSSAGGRELHALHARSQRMFQQGRRALEPSGVVTSLGGGPASPRAYPLSFGAATSPGGLSEREKDHGKDNANEKDNGREKERERERDREKVRRRPSLGFGFSAADAFSTLSGFGIVGPPVGHGSMKQKDKDKERREVPSNAATPTASTFSSDDLELPTSSGGGGTTGKMVSTVISPGRERSLTAVASEAVGQSSTPTGGGLLSRGVPPPTPRAMKRFLDGGGAISSSSTSTYYGTGGGEGTNEIKTETRSMTRLSDAFLATNHHPHNERNPSTAESRARGGHLPLSQSQTLQPTPTPKRRLSILRHVRSNSSLGIPPGEGELGGGGGPGSRRNSADGVRRLVRGMSLRAEKFVRGLDSSIDFVQGR